MSDLALFQQDLPDYLKNVQVDDLTKALAGGGGATKRISIKGSVFRMMVNGEEIAKNENRSMNVVIVNGSPKVSRTFYNSPYDPKNPAPPDCWSVDGVTPDASIETPQAKDCATCPQNIKGSGQGESRACRFKQRLAVVLADDINGGVYGIELPATSIFGNSKDINKMGFQQYAKYIGSQGKNINSLVTEMRLDSDSSTPKLTFKPVRYLQQEEWQSAVEFGNSPEAKQAVTMAFTKKESRDALPAPDAKVESEAEPAKRKKAEPAQKKDLTSVMSNWATDDE